MFFIFTLWLAEDTPIWIDATFLISLLDDLHCINTFMHYGPKKRTYIFLVWKISKDSCIVSLQSQHCKSERVCGKLLWLMQWRIVYLLSGTKEVLLKPLFAQGTRRLFVICCQVVVSLLFRGCLEAKFHCLLLLSHNSLTEVFFIWERVYTMGNRFDKLP